MEYLLNGGVVAIVGGINGLPQLFGEGTQVRSRYVVSHSQYAFAVIRSDTFLLR